LKARGRTLNSETLNAERYLKQIKLISTSGQSDTISNGKTTGIAGIRTAERECRGKYAINY
jgi:hypothetical protein